MKCTKIYNARVRLPFCSLNLLFGDVLVAVVVVICLSSLITHLRRVIYSQPRAHQVFLTEGAKTPQIKYSSHDAPKLHWLPEVLRTSLMLQFAAEKLEISSDFYQTTTTRYTPFGKTIKLFQEPWLLV